MGTTHYSLRTLPRAAILELTLAFTLAFTLELALAGEEKGGTREAGAPRDAPVERTCGYYAEMVADESWYRLNQLAEPLASLPAQPRFALHVADEVWFVCYGGAEATVVAEKAGDLKAGKKPARRDFRLGGGEPLAALYCMSSLWVLFGQKLVQFDSRFDAIRSLAVVEPTDLAFDGTDLYLLTASSIYAVRADLVPVVEYFPAWVGFSKILAYPGFIYIADGDKLLLFDNSGAQVATFGTGGRIVDMALIGYERLALVTNRRELKVLHLGENNLADIASDVDPGQILATDPDILIFSEGGSALRIPRETRNPSLAERMKVSPAGGAVACYDGTDVWVASKADLKLRCPLRRSE